MPGNAAAIIAMKRKRAEAKKNKAADAGGGGGGGPRKGAALEQPEKSEEEAEKELQRALANKAKSKKNALKYMKEMVMFFVWVLSFSATIIITREGTQSFQFANLFQAWIVGNEGWLESMKTIDDFWVFLRGSTLKILSEDLYTTIGDDFAQGRDANFLYGNRRIGQMRVRQVRVPSQMCDPKFLNVILTPKHPDYSSIRCYPEFSPSMKLETEFVKESAGMDFIPDLEAEPWFKFHDYKDLHEMSTFEAYFGSYPGSGFVLDIDRVYQHQNPQDPEELTLTIVPIDPPHKPVNVTLNDVLNSKWIDVKTRAVFVDFTFFNPNVNTFLVARLVIEILPSGNVNLYPTFRIVNPFRFRMSTVVNMVTMGMFAISGLLTLFYFQSELREIARGPMKYVKSVWSILALFNIALMLTLGYFYAMNQLLLDKIFNSDEKVFQGDMQKLGFGLDQEKNFEGLAVIVMWFRLYKYCAISRKLSTLTRTIGRAAAKLLIVMLLLLLPGVGFMLGMSLILGVNDFNFSSFSMSAYTLVLAVLGDFDASQWGSNRYLGRLLLIFWVSLTGIVILNIIVAVLCDAFATVLMENEDFDEKGIKSVWDIFVESGIFGKRISAMLNKKVEQAQDMETALANIDADGDGMTDLAELKGWMAATGAQEVLGMSAEEVMARYDNDGSGQLDEEEMEDIKNWVQREREKAEEAANAANNAVSDLDYEGSYGKPGRGGDIIDAKAVMALVHQSGGGMSLALEEKILNIENNVVDIKEKVTKMMAKLDSMATMGFAGGGATYSADAARLPGAVNGSPTKQTNMKQDGGKLVASKSLVPEES